MSNKPPNYYSTRQIYESKGVLPVVIGATAGAFLGAWLGGLFNCKTMGDSKYKPNNLEYRLH